ncbi:GMC oxidoreductase [Annulohypoxylon maeteangense]|uniref:GMC oxidoreductase n=1 Tax=Annulohypoxylon maeteangense TaxID=1927788 RepID=UPI0020086796|nr:GMC oxidoreductase [Annulohypoxylon maeteangense]KAI0884089.1 GMC oxidoreductase [Annulohypoxylon maeteangense]
MSFNKDFEFPPLGNSVLAAVINRALNQTFDYVIVGGGTAGLVLANRLTEDSGVTVAVVEAGTFPEDVVGNVTQVPAYAPQFAGAETDLEWNFTTIPQPALGNIPVSYYRAKALGGCSDINFMAYGRTSKGTHQYWADLVGDESYTYDNMVKYYKKTMNFSPPKPDTRLANATPVYNADDTSTGGGIDVTFPSFAQSWSTWVAKGLASIGLSQAQGFIDGNLLGHSWQMTAITQSTGIRSSAQAGYLRPVMSRPNLTILNGTFAERIIFNGDAAVGVEVTSKGQTYTLTTTKELVLSAGVFQSPQLLMVSGVGPKALLEQFNIPVVKDLPGVGQNLIDHITVPLSYQVNVVTSSSMGGAVLDDAIAEWNNHGTGPLSNNGGDYIGMEKAPAEFRANYSAEVIEQLSALPADWPELQYNVLPATVSSTSIGGVGSVLGANYGSMLASVIAPQSRGNVSIASARMSDAPLINPNIFTAQADIDLLLTAFKRVRQILQSSAMAPIMIGGEFFPGPTVQTDEQIMAYLTETVRPFSHGFATCKMGSASDPEAVVDSHGKVYGIKNLRVIDASSFPFLPPGPAPQIQVYTLAEKLADDIKQTSY